MFDELKGKTLTRYQLIDWAIAHQYNQLKIEEIINRALDTGANITGIVKEKYKGRIDQNLNKINFSKEELKDLCRNHGTDMKAHVKIFEALGDRARNVKQVSNCITNWKIKEELGAEHKAPDKEDNPILTCEVAGQNTETIKKDEETFSGEPGGNKLSSEDTASEEEKNGFKEAAAKLADKPKKELKVRSLQGEYHEFLINWAKQEVTILSNISELDIPVPFDHLVSLIEDLSELNDMYIRRLM